MTDEADRSARRITRRGLIGAGAAGGLALAAGGAVRARQGERLPPSPAAEQVPFHGEHQAGITTPAQDRLHFAAFDLTTDSVADLRTLLQEWTVAAARMTEGLPRRDRERGAARCPRSTPARRSAWGRRT